jgi:hypothetical protein
MWNCLGLEIIMSKLKLDQKVVEDYIAHLTKLSEDYGLTGSYKYTYQVGSSYIKIVRESNGQRMVHSFLANKVTDKFALGDILKAASWKQPAKSNPRGNVLEGTLWRVRWMGVQ